MADITSILVSIGSSIGPVEKLITGFSYLLGFMLIWAAIKKMKAIADARARYGGQGKVFIPLAYLGGGFMLFFLPTMVDVATNTFFGADSPLAYSSWIKELQEKYGDSTYVMVQLVKLAGVFWFIRGTILLVHASEPGIQHGPKGMAFLIGGIFAMNVKTTFEILGKILNYIEVNTL